MSIKRPVVYLLLILLAIAAGITSYTIASDDLAEIIRDLKQDFDIQHISIQEFKELSDSNTVIFDVRRPAEFKVSHLENAIHLDPSTAPGEFIQLHGDKLEGKTIIFYCSVGVRSSLMLSRLDSLLAQAEVKNAYNLEGGAFKWHNDNLNLTRNGESTRAIHPYSSFYARLVKDKSSIQYE